MKLNAAIREALADPAIRKRWDDMGQEVPPLDQQTPEALRAHHKAETEKWGPMIRNAGIKAQ
jgi:tripartite-type tricarboxylate transporter receptor subunit TctC